MIHSSFFLLFLTFLIKLFLPPFWHIVIDPSHCPCIVLFVFHFFSFFSIFEMFVNFALITSLSSWSSRLHFNHVLFIVLYFTWELLPFLVLVMNWCLSISDSLHVFILIIFCSFFFDQILIYFIYILSKFSCVYSFFWNPYVLFLDFFLVVIFIKSILF